MSHKFEKRWEARQNEIRDGSVLAYVTKRIAAITPPRALVVLRFLLNTTEETDRIWPNPTPPCYLTNYSRSAETGEIFGLTPRSSGPRQGRARLPERLDPKMKEGKKVRIRKIDPSDFEQLSKHSYSLSPTEALTDIEKIAAAFEKTRFWTAISGAVAVVSRNGGRLLGTIQFHPPRSDRHGLEIGYVTHDVADRRKGYMSEAVDLLVELLFLERPNVHRIELGTIQENVASWKLAERCGFKREGAFRNAEFRNGEPITHLVYSIIREDLKHRSNQSVLDNGG